MTGKLSTAPSILSEYLAITELGDEPDPAAILVQLRRLATLSAGNWYDVLAAQAIISELAFLLVEADRYQLPLADVKLIGAVITSLATNSRSFTENSTGITLEGYTMPADQKN